MNGALGVDPGARSGAAVVLAPDGRAVLGWWAWQEMPPRCRRRVRLRSWLGADTHGLRLLDALRLIRAGIEAIPGIDSVILRLSLEGLFIPAILKKDGKTSPGEVGALHEAAGIALGVLGPLDPDRDPLRPLASEWRRRQLGIAGASAELAERVAVQRAALAFVWPRPDLPGDPAGLDWLTAVERGAVGEAAWIARDGIRSNWPPAPSSTEDPIRRSPGPGG